MLYFCATNATYARAYVLVALDPHTTCDNKQRRTRATHTLYYLNYLLKYIKYARLR